MPFSLSSLSRFSKSKGNYLSDSNSQPQYSKRTSISSAATEYEQLKPTRKESKTNDKKIMKSMSPPELNRLSIDRIPLMGACSRI
jgi:hypothetical protein